MSRKVQLTLSILMILPKVIEKHSEIEVNRIRNSIKHGKHITIKCDNVVWFSFGND